MILPVLKHGLHRRSARVPEGIRERLTAYAINFLSHKRPKRARRALHDELILDLPWSREVV